MTTPNDALALRTINFLTDPANDPDSTAAIDLRNLLIDIDHDDTDSYLADALRDCIRALDTHTISMLRLDFSLCPMHACDYAICFDDDDPECASIRACFPTHDT